MSFAFMALHSELAPTKLCSKSSLYKTVPVQKNSFTKEASVTGAMPTLFFQSDGFEES